MAAEIIPLIQAFVEIADFRQASGKRYPLPAVLALACAAMLCGYRSYGAIAEWGRNYDRELVLALGFAHGKTPCASALHWIFRHLDCAQFESQLGQWTETVLQAYPPSAEQVEGIAIDGKTLRGSQKQGAPGAHLLSALSHRLGITLAQKQEDTIASAFDFMWGQIIELLKGNIPKNDLFCFMRKLAPCWVC